MRQHERKARSNTRALDCCLSFAHGFEVETAVDNCSGGDEKDQKVVYETAQALSLMKML